MPFLIERFVRNPLLDPKAKPTVPDGISKQKGVPVSRHT